MKGIGMCRDWKGRESFQEAPPNFSLLLVNYEQVIQHIVKLFY